ncbi:MAG: hypothetical protein P0Y65_10065 [Candidatus Devosia phytovorans]|uniref:Uncharacterized protein n=1 Tax=Candidatus Devosia phytovorans TaxID=3121372 RepID=A0AAJ6B3L1_9HYPH|nr:hypothetical protein [Devosia sp.]WEK06563.1 MAG: hypothetical protein P0Y65_10065 [Devosia sp.]
MDRHYLDLALPVGKGRQMRIVERPGLWMPQAELLGLVAQLRTIASRTLADKDLDYGIFSGDPERLEASFITLVTDKRSGAPIAFNALPVIALELDGRSVELVHLGLVMVDPDQRSKGLSWVLYGLTCFLLFIRNQGRPIWVSNVTQVPAVVGMVTETFSEVYPDPEGNSPRKFRQLVLVRQIMAAHRHVFGVGPEAGFDEQSFVITNAYTGGSDNLKKSFEVAQKHRRAAFNDYCQTHLDYERGDDVIQIGKLDLAAARRYLSEMVPKGALGLVAVAAVMALVQRAILPVVQWLDGKREFGRLRPRSGV